MASGIYDVFKVDLMDASVNIASGGDTLQVALLDNSHAFTASDTVWGSISANEIAGTGYSAGGETLANQTVSLASNTATFDGDDTSWTSATFTCYHAAIYDSTNTSSLICSIDFGGAQTVTAGTFTIEWNANGIISLA
jgi:hypothetical protein